MVEENNGADAEISQAVLDSSPKNFMTSTPRSTYDRNSNINSHLNPQRRSQDLPQSPSQIQEVLQGLPSAFHLLQQQQEQLQNRGHSMLSNSPRQSDQRSASAHEALNLEKQQISEATNCEATNRANPALQHDNLGFVNRMNTQGMESHSDSLYGTPHGWPQTKLPGNRLPWEGGDGSSPEPQKKEQKKPKERKSITTKTFAKGMMDVSLLTSNATQLRAVMSNPEHEFYTLLIWLIAVSVVIQVLSSVLLIMSDFYKTQVKETDRQNQRKRKALNFLALALITIVTSLNVLISAFYAPSTAFNKPGQTNVPQFSQTSIMGTKHSEL